MADELAKALENLTADRRVIAPLVERFPSGAQWKQDLAWFDEQIAALRVSK